MTAASTGPRPARVTVVHAPACHFCEDAFAALDELGTQFAFEVQRVDAEGEFGRQLLELHRAPLFPLVLVDDHFFSCGRLPRKKLVKLLQSRTAAVA